MYLINDFYKALTPLIIGLFTGGILNHLFIHYIQNKYFSRDKKRIDATDGELRNKSKSLTKENGEYKIALLVRHDLKMGKGKVAAQCSHAIVHCYEKGLRSRPIEIKGWESNNKQVDIFKVADEETMLKYQQLANENGYNNYIVVDAGRTQVAPSSKTVMAVGPVENEMIDLFTQNLQCAVLSVNAFNKSKLYGLPSKCARIVLRVPDLKTLECIQKQCKLFDIHTATFTENDQVTVLAIGPANEVSINAQVHDLKLY